MRARLTLIIVLAMLPAVAFSVASAVQQYEERKEFARRELLRIADLMPHEIGTVFSSAEEMMLVARTQEAVAQGLSPACTQVLAGALAGRESFANIWTVDPKGTPVCSAVELAGAASYAETPWFQRLQRLRTFSVSAPLEGDTTFVAAVPLADAPPSEPIAVTVVSIRTTLLDRFRHIASVSDDTYVYLLNADGELLLKQGSEDLLPAEDVYNRILTDQGFVTAPSRSGASYLYAAMPLAEGELVGLVAHRVIGADAPLLAKLAFEAGLPLVLAAVTLLIVWLAIDRVSTRWIRRLRQVVMAHEGGALAVRASDLEAAPLEYRELGDTVNAMADAIEHRQRKLVDAATVREMLLREVHHRVKNNLQIIISLFNLMARNTNDEDTRLLIRDMLARIECLALVHHAAYRSGDVQHINMDSFVPELLTSISRTFDEQLAPIHIGSKVDAIALSMDETIPLAQLLTEAVTNSLKHAFLGRKSGRIVVRLERIGAGLAMLEISDDGVGLPAGFDDGPPQSRLGFSLMTGFAQQLGGTVTVRADRNGTRISATLRYAELQDEAAAGTVAAMG